jgi:hypothetical protein
VRFIVFSEADREIYERLLQEAVSFIERHHQVP